MNRRLPFRKKTADFYDKTAAVIRTDARSLPIPDETVDLIVTSPPYFALRSYRDGGEHFEQIGDEATPQQFVDALTECMVEWRRVLKPEGSVWINLGDKYAGSGGHNNSNIGVDSSRGPSSYNKDAGHARAKSLMGLPWRFAIAQIDAGWILRAEVVWAKPNGLPESVTDRVRRSHEQWFHFVKEPRYYSAVDELREPHTSPLHSPGQSRITADRNDGDRNDRVFGNSLGRVPGSVWTIPTEPLTIPDDIREAKNLPDHFAAFPQEWPRRIILGWSPSGICVECGEGRRPTVQTDLGAKERNTPKYDKDGRANHDGDGSTLGSRGPTAVITGEQCACESLTAPTTKSIIVDPFGGTGTVAGVARALNRYGISNDLSADYNRLAIWRIWESGHFERGHDKYLSEKAVGPTTPIETYLMSFPGIGKVSAQAIVDAVGNPFTLTGDITEAKGVGVKAVEKMREALGEFDSWVTVEGGEVQS